MATKQPRYTVSVDDELFQKIEDFRFENRFQTRSDATVALLKLGIESLEAQKKTPSAESAESAVPKKEH